jgi:hypothetical protein
MKLERILENLNSFEKNSFLKNLDSLISEKPKNIGQIERILSESNRDLKNMDNINIAKVFKLLESEYKSYLKTEFLNTTSQFDILIDLISREGKSIIKIDWFSRLYEKEILKLNKKLKEFNKQIEDESSSLDFVRRRQYKIYKACLKTAYFNDATNNQDKKISGDEHSILITLSNELGLSQEEVRLINYLIIPVEKLDVAKVINDLKSMGVLFFSKKSNTIYVADEMKRVLRGIRGKEVPDKYFRRVLRSLREPQINAICKKHSIDWKMSYEDKIKSLISEGVTLRSVLLEDLYKLETKLSEKKKLLGEFCANSLGIPNLKGSLIEEKVDSLIEYFEELEEEEKIGISVEGYEKLTHDLSLKVKGFNEFLRNDFEFQEEHVLKANFLLDHNIKPRDILEYLTAYQLNEFATSQGIKTRGDIIHNVLEFYKDTENLLIENYELIGYRDVNGLKENSIAIKEADLGLKFEEVTKLILEKLGFNVDETARKKLNTAKDKIDLIVNLGKQEVILIECKTVKENGFNKFSSVSRQLKSYFSLATKNDYKVVKSLLIAPEFSDEFVKECGLEYELNLSLISAKTLVRILEGYKASKLKQFPHNLFMRDVVIQEDRVLKAISK